MTTNAVKGLSGLILASPNPDQLAGFYRKALGIPLELRSHGGFGDHWECDFEDVHFAVLKQGPATGQNNPIVPSFHVDNIEAFVEEHGLILSYPLMNLGEGNFVGEISDPDGNPIRLWMHKK
jgi:predicted enzyme related to lactoylglutathione lyase